MNDPSQAPSNGLYCSIRDQVMPRLEQYLDHFDPADPAKRHLLTSLQAIESALNLHQQVPLRYSHIFRHLISSEAGNPELLEQLFQAHPTESLPYYSAAELLAADLPEPEYLIEDLLPEGCTLLAAAPKVGKTRLAFDIALAVASGSRALGSLPASRSRRVYYLALEGGIGSIKAILECLTAGAEAPTDLLIFQQWERGERGIERLVRASEADPRLGLVVIDTLHHFRPRRNRSSYQEDYNAVCQPRALLPPQRRLCADAAPHPEDGSQRSPGTGLRYDGTQRRGRQRDGAKESTQPGLGRAAPL